MKTYKFGVANLVAGGQHGNYHVMKVGLFYQVVYLSSVMYPVLPNLFWRKKSAFAVADALDLARMSGGSIADKMTEPLIDAWVSVAIDAGLLHEGAT